MPPAGSQQGSKPASLPPVKPGDESVGQELQLGEYADTPALNPSQAKALIDVFLKQAGSSGKYENE